MVLPHLLLPAALCSLTPRGPAVPAPPTPPVASVRLVQWLAKRGQMGFEADVVEMIGPIPAVASDGVILSLNVASGQRRIPSPCIDKLCRWAVGTAST